MTNSNDFVKCLICGRVHHVSMGDSNISDETTGNSDTCCFCKNKLKKGMWPIKVEGRNEYVFWAQSEDVRTMCLQYKEFKHDVVYVETKRSCIDVSVLVEGSPLTKALYGRLGKDVIQRSIHSVDGKPVFHWGYHKFMWGTMVKHPNLNKTAIWEWMSTLFTNIKRIDRYRCLACFACLAVKNRNDTYACHAEPCPLEWVRNKPYRCIHSSSPYYKWTLNQYVGYIQHNSTDVIKAIKNAPLIPDVEKYYTIDD